MKRRGGMYGMCGKDEDKLVTCKQAVYAALPF